MDSLKGNKTYIVAFLIALATAAKVLGYITEDNYTAIMGFLLSFGGVTMAAKMNRGVESIRINELKLNHLLGVNAVQNTMRQEAGITPSGFVSAGTSMANQRVNSPLERTTEFTRKEIKYNPPLTKK